MAWFETFFGKEKMFIILKWVVEFGKFGFSSVMLFVCPMDEDKEELEF